jgi:hypothetical protein
MLATKRPSTWNLAAQAAFSISALHYYFIEIIASNYFELRRTVESVDTNHGNIAQITGKTFQKLFCPLFERNPHSPPHSQVAEKCD